MNLVCDLDCKMVYICFIIELERMNFDFCKIVNFIKIIKMLYFFLFIYYRRLVSKIYIYIIVGLAVVVFILFIVVGIICIRRRRYFIFYRFLRFFNLFGRGSIN